MNWPHLHLVVNHFPIILIVGGTLAGIAGLIGRRAAIWQYALVSVLLAGLTSPVAYFTGERAEEVVEEFRYINEPALEEHEEAGLYAMITLLLAGCVAAAALWKKTQWLRVLALATALVAAVVTGHAALEGGRIIHDAPALRRAPPR